MQNFRVGHVPFMLFVLISFALVTQREPSLQWNMGFTLQDDIIYVRCGSKNLKKSIYNGRND